MGSTQEYLGEGGGGTIVIKQRAPIPVDSVGHPDLYEGQQFRVDGTQHKHVIADVTDYSPGAGSGDVVGPSSATDGHFAKFDTATGKKIKDGTVLASDVPSLTLAKISDAGGAASLNVGTGAGTVAAGDHGHEAGAGVPSGAIMMWSGLKSAIPTGWHLCDGNNGTPNLLDRFVMSVGAANEAGGTGGSATLTHSGAGVGNHDALTHSGAAVDQHAALSHSGSAVGNHTNVAVPATATAAVKIGTSTSSAAANTHTHTIATITHSVTQPSDHSAQTHTVTQPSQHTISAHSVTQPSDHTDARPPYFLLCFIMKA